jgi:rhamnopyranosyl-N-acetylglucosaminyl-diphospho-decaprenol beta-1,3/1,4-galactofuranosyltransferase
MNKRVAAVVVTYNRLNLLKECIEAIRNQTRKPEAIIVVNNGSTDGTELWLESQNDLTVYNQQNVGGAGGFNRGIKEAYESDFDWIWAMDDDGCPALDCVEALIAASGKKPGVNVWGGIVLDRDDHSKLAFDCQQVVTETGEINWGIEFIDNWAPFFNGVMFSRDIVKKFGYPNPAFFIWGDEGDYFERTKQQGIIASTTKAIFYHPKDRLYSTMHRNQYVYDGPVNWKAYCFFRNRAYLGRKHYNRTETGSLLNQFYYLYDKLPLGEFLKTIPLLLKAHWDGFNFNLKRKLPY